MENVDVLIIGGGPAGVSASLYTARANFKTVIISKDNGALDKANVIENYYGIESISGNDLVKIGIEQAKKFGVTVLENEVVGISYENGYIVNLTDKSIRARAIIIATGSKRKTLPIKNLEKYEGFGVSYCAVCDAYFYKNQNIGVMGNGKYALHEINTLLNVTDKITLFTNGEKVITNFPENINIIESKISEIYGNEIVEGVLLENKDKIEISGLFVAIGFASGSDLLKKLGVVVKDDKIQVDENMKTSLDGIYSAGDCTGGMKQISIAVGEGAKAGLSVINFLRTNK